MEQRVYYRWREERPNSVGRNVLTEEMKLLSSAFEMCGQKQPKSSVWVIPYDYTMWKVAAR